MPAAPTVMGTPTASSWRSVSRREGGTSRASGRVQRREVRYAVTKRPSAAPAVTPPMAPAAHSAAGAFRFSSTRHSARPMTSLPADSVICPAAVGSISPSPWPKPRRADDTHTSATAGPNARMAWAAASSCSHPASIWGMAHMTALHTRPMAASSASAVRKPRRAPAYRRWAAALATRRLNATGSPAVDSTSSRL